ncbi:meiotic recombination protein SPO11-like isoform X2 [Paramacrobiotus metropolitanus]|uniref:meiotic recombination protein SPO11-like isoform X2 n=1 Tax=Paramacrobiotus metropolitanus TaxID=2943436 RepID=UPI00244576FC|nr:meiotic recombination protein SPO11-like isoform X2 [Paramacrobiotus metropolitanus]
MDACSSAVAVYQQTIENHAPVLFFLQSERDEDERSGEVQLVRIIVTESEQLLHFVLPSGHAWTVSQSGSHPSAPYQPGICAPPPPLYTPPSSFDPVLYRNFGIMRKISRMFLTICQQLRRGLVPGLDYEGPGTQWDDFMLDDEGVLAPKPDRLRRNALSLFPERNARKFIAVVKVLARIYMLLKENLTATLRALFYEDVPFFIEQEAVNCAVNIITLMLRVPRYHLNIVASEKALVAGHLSFRDNNVIFDCMHTYSGISIPTSVDNVEILQSDAQVIFIIEKDATFQQLIAEGICGPEFPLPCIVMTGKGYPDYSIRLFLRKLWIQLQIPIFLITDSDPHGMDIMLPILII